MLALFAGERASEARLHPYYIVRTAAYGQLTPRVLFVLDTSGTMSFRANDDDVVCRWDECEAASMVGTENESRISAARRAIQNVAIATGDAAEFALMTFDQRPARSGGTAPDRCNPGSENERFVWVTDYEWENGAGAVGPIERDGYTGAMRLCQGDEVRPYPYLRWDELGAGSVIAANNESGAPPASPLVGTTLAERTSPANEQRRVQWFPRFLGVRVHLDDTTDLDHSITYATAGDWGATDIEKDAEVRGHDFYYWPYVDGFPGYANWHVSPDETGTPSPGIAGNDPAINGAQLYSPFYLDLSASAVPATDWGPANQAEAVATLQTYTSPIASGGVDAAGPKAWSSAIGDVIASPPSSNLQFSHTSVASYLSFIRDNVSAEACAPAIAVLVTDGAPSEGGDPLYARLAALRNDLGVRTYVIAFDADDGLGGPIELDFMACAAAGACDAGVCSTPCDDTPAKAWDTCSDPTDPGDNCAYTATTPAELEAAVTDILTRTADITVESGPRSSVNEFGVGAGGDAGEGEILQTEVRAYTEYPSWRGHVVRKVCDTLDGGGVLQPYCTSPVPEFTAAEAEETFGPCPQSRNWDAGECLQQTAWIDRRIYTNTSANTVVPIAEADGSASAVFVTELESLGLLTSADHAAEADAIVAFLLGRDAPGGWKLPGLANSAPVVVRRVPPHRTEKIPEVGIKDPHCAGRFYTELVAGSLPISLRDFAKTSDETVIDSPTRHREYLEAVMIGDDMGILHAFQLDSGNELWGFLPRAALVNAVAEVANGPTRMGQPQDLDDHIHGIAATLTHGFAYTTGATPRWVHLGVFGMGEGGDEYYGLDLSHMSPVSSRGPFEVLWSSEDAAIAAQYDQYNGETWARPALSYRVPNDSLTFEPLAYLVLGSGYPVDSPAPTEQGRTLVLANATTGAIIETAELPDIVEPVYEPSFGAVVDPAVGSHCLSRFWGEMQETYIADPAGRLFRWDLGAIAAHEADSVSPWGGAAQPVFRFPACESTGSDCTVDLGNRGDPFLFGPAVSASNRIDDFTAFQAGSALDELDQFLVALVSGSPNDDTLDATLAGNAFHSSLYILVDDHRLGDKGLGFDIPAGAPKLSADAGAGTYVGLQENYLRMAISDIERLRIVTPYPGAPPFTESGTFSRGTRPVRAPRILVTGVVDQATDQVIEGIEVFFIQFTLFEPGSFTCDPRFYDASTDTWYADFGSTYEVAFRLTADVDSGFNFITGSQAATADFGAGFQPGLTLASVTQVNDDNCAGGNCGATPGNTSAPVPCDNNSATGGAVPGTPTGFALSSTNAQIVGFTPVE